MTENHQRFLGHLEDSVGAVWTVAQWLHSRGHHVKINASGRASKHNEWKEYADTGDLEISLRVEVKRLSCEFKDAGDWPFKDKFIVCARHAWDRATPKPYAFIYLNKSKTHAACVMGSDWKSWVVDIRTDRRYEDIQQEFYFAPMDSVTFVKLCPNAPLENS